MGKFTRIAPEPNPFVQTLTIPILWKLRSSEGVENPTGTKTLGRYPLEVEQRVNFYTDRLLPLFLGLTPSAKDMVLYIAAHLSVNQDYLELREDRYCTDMQVSHSTYLAARTQLLNRLIIPRVARKHTYWVNPALMFKGKRLEKYPDKITPINQDPFEKLFGTTMMAAPDGTLST